MSDVAGYIKRVAEKLKYNREAFVERNIPTDASNVLAMSYYGDLPSTFVLSSFLLKRYKELYKNKYLILCSWPGFRGFFPYVDEYWYVNDDSVHESLALGADFIYNGSTMAKDLGQGLLECMNTLNYRDLREYYAKGFTTKYWEQFCEVKRYLPSVPSETILSEGFRKQIDCLKGKKILVHPVRRMRSWQRGKTFYVSVPREFWAVLLDALLEDGYSPVIYQNWFTYDMSRDFTDRCAYLVSRNISDILSAIRYIGLVLDVHSGVSRLAIAARTPYLAVDERLRYIEERDYVIDDLSCGDLPRSYVFSFATYFLTGGSREWKTSAIDTILARLKDFVLTASKTGWGETAESYLPVSYDVIKTRKARRLGVHFIKSSKNR